MERDRALNRLGLDHRPTRYALRSARVVRDVLGRPEFAKRVVVRLENRLRRLRNEPRAK